MVGNPEVMARVPINGLIAEVGFSTKTDGKPTYQEPEAFRSSNVTTVISGLHRTKKERQLGLLANAILPSRICDAGDNPLTIRTDKVEQVGPAVIYLAIDQKLERGPDHGEIVIDPHQRIMNAFLNVRGSRFSYPVCEIFKSHLRRLPVPHEHHRAAGQQRFLDRGGVALRHAIKHLRYRREDRLLLSAIGQGNLAVER